MAETYPVKSWWDGKPDHSAYQVFKWIEENDQDRLLDYRQFMRLYANRDVLDFGPLTHRRMRSRERVTLNVIKSVIDTVSARIAKNRPRPRFLTSGGNYSTQKRARLLERWVDAQFYTTSLYKIAPQVFRDAAAFGSGALKVFRKGKKIHVERVFPGELFVDRAEGLYGSPRQIHQRKYIDRKVLLAMLEKLGKDRKLLTEVREAEGRGEDAYNELSGLDAAADQVEVLMSWRLPSAPGEKDGRYSMMLQELELHSEPYDKDYFPFIFLHWTEPLRGFWGAGLADELLGIQVEINRLLQKIQKSMHLMSVPQWWVEQGSKVKQNAITNEVGAVNRYVGKPPVVYTPPVMPPEVYMHLERLIGRAYEIAGVSRLSAGSMKPPELESGRALREYHDIETERFALISRAWEEFFMEVARHMVGLGKEISEQYSDYKVVTQKDRFTIEEVSWKDVDLEADSYVLQVFPSSSLPSTPAGRIATVSDLLNLQLIDPQEGKRLLDFPDLEEHMALDRAASENIDRIIERILDDEEYEAPEPFQDHQLALKKVQAAYQRALGKEDITEEQLAALRQFMTATHALMMKAQQQALAQAAGAQQPIPGAPPAPGPTGQAPGAVLPQDGTMIA